MQHFSGKPVIGGQAHGPALFTDQGVNFTAGFTKPRNLLPWKRSEFSDPNHPWCGTSLKGKIVFIPSCIGSTYTGLVLLDAVRHGLGPSAIVAEDVDPLLVSGVVVSSVWYERSIPIVEHPMADFSELVGANTRARVDGDTGGIEIG